MGGVIAGPPLEGDAPPPSVVALADGQPIRAVWVNELGGRTFAFGDRYVKWTPHESGLDLVAEGERLGWAGAFTSVPQVVELGADDEATWMVTVAIPGENAVTPRWRAEPAIAVRAIGEGLRALHESLPVESCPFDWSAAARVKGAEQRAASGSIDPARWHADHHHLDVDRALAVLRDVPPLDRLVVAHGDACAPNTLIDEHGRCTGHVDLGALGVADRWADLAVATWSTTWNYGPGWEGELLAAYGIAPDPARTAYYRLLWDLGP